MVNDMTKESPAKLILYFSIPLLIGNIFQQLYSMVDTIIVGRAIGVNALAAVGSTGSISFLIIGFITGITGGFAVVTSQCFGAKDYDSLRRSVASSIVLCIIITIIVTVISLIYVRPLLQLMKTPINIIDDATSYITVILGGTAATVFYNMISSILRALGDSRTPLYFLIVSSVINIILDLVFIMIFSMGVAGAGYATVISQAVSGFLCLIYTVRHYDILRLKKEDWKLEYAFTIKHITIGLPMALQFSVTAIGVMVLQSALNRLGAVKIAAYTASAKVEQLVTQPAATFGITMATYCGQNLGAGRMDRIKEGVRKCSFISFAFSVAAGIIVIAFGPFLTGLFVNDGKPEVIHEVIQNAQYYLNIVAVFFPVLGLLFIYRNALQGMGESIVPLLAGGIELLLRVAVAFTLPSFIGYTGICFASPVAWIGAMVLLAVAYFISIHKKTRHNILS